MPEDRNPPGDERTPGVDGSVPLGTMLDHLDDPNLWKDGPEDRKQRFMAKKTLLLASLETGKTQVRLDARRPGCAVPEHLADQLQLALNLSWRFPDSNMVIDDQGVTASLRFSGRSFRCHLPWVAIWGLALADDPNLRVWPIDLPPELGGPPRTPEGVWTETSATPFARPHLSVVSSQSAPSDGPALDEARSSDDAPPAPRTPWLRLVK
jgi:hypothetical protein